MMLKKFLFRSLLVMAAVAIAPVHGQTQTGAAALNVFFSAKRAATLEPCGCHTAAQGGVANEAAIVYPEHANGLPDIRVDAGQWMSQLGSTSPLFALQSQYELLALELMHYDAINFAVQDALLGREYMANFARKHPKAVKPIVSANVFLRDKPDQLAFEPYRIIERKLGDGSVKRIAVTGVTDLKLAIYGAIERVDPKTHSGAQVLTRGYALKDPVESLKPVMAELKSKSDLILVLHSGNFDGAQNLLKAIPDIPYLITTATVNDPSIQFPFDASVILRVIGASGQQIGLMTLRPRGSGWEFVSRPEMIEVRSASKSDPKLGELVAQFNKITGKDLATTQPQVSRNYAGAHRCIPCHQEIYKSWKATPHARAMEQLINKGEQFNPGLLRRATTAYGQPGGFAHPRLAQSQTLMDVQCEACHGPALAHTDVETRLKSAVTPADKAGLKAEAKKTLPRKNIPADLCRKCHDPKFSPDFNYNRDYGKVKHGR